MKTPLYKSCSIALKDVDTVKGIVSGYFSAFGNTDYHGDIIAPGAYRKSISERGPKADRPSRIHHLLEHDIEQPVGKLTGLYEDTIGLGFESMMSKTQLGRDTLIRYQEGIYNEHSVGIYVDKAKTETDAKGNRVIKEAMLIEGSTVLMGANPNTPVTGIKGLISPERLQARADNIAAYLKSGRHGSDALFMQLEKELETAKRLLAELTAIKSALPATQPERSTEPPRPAVDADAIAKAVLDRIRFHN